MINTYLNDLDAFISTSYYKTPRTFQLLRLHSSKEFKNHLVILSPKRAKWVHTAQLPSTAVLIASYLQINRLLWLKNKLNALIKMRPDGCFLARS